VSFTLGDPAVTVTVPVGTTIYVHQQGQFPTKEIVIRVTATRIVPNRAPAPTSGTERTREQIQKFVNTTQTDTRQLTKGQPGVAEDSAGQQHVRGEHADITYVVDGVQLPDTLSGRQGAIVIPSTIQNLEIITGGFAPQFGGQTAAVLNIATLSSFKTPESDVSLQGGSFQTYAGDFTSRGPLGSKMSYVVDLNANRTTNAIEPQQPNDQSAHNGGDSESGFLKFAFTPSARDSVTLTMSGNPNYLQIGNRTGLPDSFYQSGEGYGFLGLRNADGTRPASTIVVPGGLGSQKILLASQQQDGMDIDQREVDEFGVLNFQHRFSRRDSAQLAFTLLHSGQDVYNFNPSINMGELPIDSSIEFNPTAHRNVHHLQISGAYDAQRGPHALKGGFLFDDQSGAESYQIIPASQLALDELASLDSALAPTGTYNPKVLDVNGYPVYTATSGVIPTVNVQRSGHYAAGYLQDTWKSGHLVSNYGLRLDHYFQHESISTINVDTTALSPRVNFEYKMDRVDDLRWSYNRILNTPPLAQGAIIGTPIQPEIIDQYDVAVSRQLSKYQTANLAYYVKQIQDQVDTGLLIPGSEIGLYSAVNFQHGGIHGVEASYDISAPHGVGWDEYLNYSYSTARPSGLDNTGAPVPTYNDHDQRHTLGIGLAYTWKSGLSIAGTYQYNSGLASSVVSPGTERTPRMQLDLHSTTGDRLFKGHGGLELDVNNVFDSRQVINFQSGFSGTRFQQGRSLTIGANLKF
jgi:outer membrane cobalamin receptor